MDIANNFQFWRFHHMKTVERIIGHKKGSGGSSGVEFLKKALDVDIFPGQFLNRGAFSARVFETRRARRARE